MARLLKGNATVQGGDNKPYFKVYMSADQTITNGAEPVLQFNTKVYDSASAFNTTSYRFTPQTAGYYFLQVSVYMAVGGDQLFFQIRKNGTGQGPRFDENWGSRSATGTQNYSIPGVIVQANGSTDYFDVTFYQNTGSSHDVKSGSQQTIFQGFKLLF
jgi:hypothetical protein